MRLKIKSPIFFPPETITSLGREIVVIAAAPEEGNPGGVVEDDKSMYTRHSWRQRLTW